MAALPDTEADRVLRSKVRRIGAAGALWHLLASWFFATVLIVLLLDRASIQAGNLPPSVSGAAAAAAVYAGLATLFWWLFAVGRRGFSMTGTLAAGIGPALAIAVVIVLVGRALLGDAAEGGAQSVPPVVGLLSLGIYPAIAAMIGLWIGVMMLVVALLAVAGGALLSLAVGIPLTLRCRHLLDRAFPEIVADAALTAPRAGATSPAAGETA